MLQLSCEGDGGVRLQGVHVPAQVIGKLHRGLFRLSRVGAAERLDHGEGVIQKMGLDLGHHDLNALLGLQRPLVLPYELEMQPDIIDHAVNDGGEDEVGHGLVEVIGVEVQRQRPDNELEHQYRQPGFPARLRLEHAHRQQEPVAEKKRADIEARVRQGAPDVMVVPVDSKADGRKQRRGVYCGIYAHQRPDPPEFLFRHHDAQKKRQHHRAHGIAVDRRQRPRKRPRLPDHQAVFQMILEQKTEHHGNNDPHDPLEVGADIGVDVHDHCQQAQQRQRREQRQRLDIVLDDENTQLVVVKNKRPHREQNGRRGQRRDGRQPAAIPYLFPLEIH